jgi:hypothetical protein
MAAPAGAEWITTNGRITSALNIKFSQRRPGAHRLVD